MRAMQAASDMKPLEAIHGSGGGHCLGGCHQVCLSMGICGEVSGTTKAH